MFYKNNTKTDIQSKKNKPFVFYNISKRYYFRTYSQKNLYLKVFDNYHLNRNI